MSGHSKWSTIKRQKGMADVKRGQLFTKLANTITIAVREGGGGDPATNFKLRLAIEQARAVNMPKENISRAIDRGLGSSVSGAIKLESVTYEGYGPGKVALIVEAATDNKNRTIAQVRGLIEHAGGTFASRGAVSWMFSDVGAVTVAKNGRSFDEIFDLAAQVGAEDVEDAGDLVEIYTKPNALEAVKGELIRMGFSVRNAEIAKKPSTSLKITDPETAKKVLGLMEKLEGLDDVARVSSNFEIADDLLTQIQDFSK